jgi:uncharacterized membrane-anchored protein
MRVARPLDAAPALWNKVPAITLSFWLIKVLSTTVGETGADYVAVHVGLGAALTTALMSVLLAGALLLKSQSQPLRAVDLLALVLLSVVGTQITDTSWAFCTRASPIRSRSSALCPQPAWLPSLHCGSHTRTSA